MAYSRGTYPDRQSRVAQQSQQYDQVRGTPLGLQGQDALPPGQSTLDTRRPSAFLARAYRYPVFDANSGNAFLPEQIITLPPGQSTGPSELPPRAPARARDLLTLADASEFWLFGTDAMATGAQVSGNAPAGSRRATDYKWTQDLIPTLLGQDAMAAGEQLSGNVPAGPRRAVDYTHTQDLIPNLVGQDAMLVGAQSTALPPIAALRARDYSFTPPINLPTLTTVVQPLPAGQQLTDSLPPRAVARARDYSIAESFPLTLISQDAFNAGAQSFALPPIAALRSRDYSFVPPVNLCCLTTVAQQIPPGQQTTDSLPPKAAARARDYTHLDQTRRHLIGQDALPTGQNADRTALPPKGAQRARDYTWTQPYQLYVFEQLPTGDSTALTEGPPKGPLRLRDYTHLDLTKQNLIGQDSMVAGQSWLVSDNLPPRAYARLVDYSWSQSFSLPELQLTTRPGHHALNDRALFIQTLTDRALILHNLRDQEAGG